MFGKLQNNFLWFLKDSWSAWRSQTFFWSCRSFRMSVKLEKAFWDPGGLNIFKKLFCVSVSLCESPWVILSRREWPWVAVSHRELTWVSVRISVSLSVSSCIFLSHCESSWVSVSLRESLWVSVSLHESSWVAVSRRDSPWVAVILSEPPCVSVSLFESLWVSVHSPTQEDLSWKKCSVDATHAKWKFGSNALIRPFCRMIWREKLNKMQFEVLSQILRDLRDKTQYQI